MTPSRPWPDQIYVMYCEAPPEPILAKAGLSLPATPTRRLPDGSSIWIFAHEEGVAAPMEDDFPQFSFVSASRGNAIYSWAMEGAKWNKLVDPSLPLNEYWDEKTVDLPFAPPPTQAVVDRLSWSLAANP